MNEKKYVWVKDQKGKKPHRFTIYTHIKQYKRTCLSRECNNTRPINITRTILNGWWLQNTNMHKQKTWIQTNAIRNSLCIPGILMLFINVQLNGFLVK